MSDLQVALLVLGVLVIGCVIVYNCVQESRFRKCAETSLGSDYGDVLLELVVRGRTNRIEPYMLAEVGEPHIVFVGRVESSGMSPVSVLVEEVLEQNSLLDYIVDVMCQELLHCPVLQQLVEVFEFCGRWSYVMVSFVDGIWVFLVSASESVSELRVSFQLVDRRGYVTDDDLIAFQVFVKEWVEEVGAKVQVFDVGFYSQVAKEFDRFCAEVDVLVGLNVVFVDDVLFAGEDVWRCAEVAGFRLENGVFWFEDVQGNGLFSLEHQQGESFDPDWLCMVAVVGVILLFDVLRLEDGLKIFDYMLDIGRQLASVLGGILVDDNRASVIEVGLEQIRAQLRKIYAAMELKGICVGSSVVLRLFS